MPLAIAADVLSTSVASPVTVTDSVRPPTPIVASAAVVSASSTRTFLVTVCIPDNVNVSAYSPGGNWGSWNEPSDAVVVTRGPGSTSARASTVTPGSTPPLVSVTLPAIDPV